LVPEPLDWPPERAGPADETPRWSQPQSNLVLDFHGDPLRARLVVFSDGNHHMALEECLRGFCRMHPEVRDVFYATTPPSALLNLLAAGGLDIGNLRLSVVPHVFISPPAVLNRVVAAGRMTAHRPFMRSRGNVLLVRKGNPKAIRGIDDLARDDVRLFLSSPMSEAASYEVYRATLDGLARRQGMTSDIPEARIVYGQRIHHREAPQALADERADAALVYYHLALRYTRIFPQRFEIVTLDDAPSDRAVPENIISRFHVGVIGDGGEWGGRLLAFLLGEDVTAIYRRHGLERV
jgi:ABC-type amino acid transport substrate-binding protein